MVGMTRILTRSDIVGTLDVDTATDTLREGFRRDDEATAQARRVRADLPGEGTATALVPGLVPGIPAYTAKVNAKFPSTRPALRGVVCLHDLDEGRLLALLDSATVTAWRTGLAAALGTDLLAPDPATTLGIVGAGAQAELAVHGLCRLRVLDEIVISDTDDAAARQFARRHTGICPTRVAGSPAEVAARADMVILATWSREPLLGAKDTRPALHLTTLGFDEPGKQELSTELLHTAELVVDDRRLATESGVLGTAGIDPDEAGTLGEVLRGSAGRPDNAPTVYAPVGLPWQDLALAWSAYCSAELYGIGTDTDLLG